LETIHFIITHLLLTINQYQVLTTPPIFLDLMMLSYSKINYDRRLSP